MSHQDIYAANLSSFSECHVAGIVFLFFTAVVLKPSTVLGSTAGLSSTFVERKQELCMQQKTNSPFSEVNENLCLLSRSRQGVHDHSANCAFGSSDSKQELFYDQNESQGMYHILSEPSLSEMLLVLLLS